MRRNLQRVVNARKRSLTGKLNAGILRKWPKQLTLGRGGGGKCQGLPVHKKGIGSRLQQRDRRLSSGGELRGRLSQQNVRDLIDLLRVLFKVGALGAHIRRGQKKSRRKLSFNTHIPLLHISGRMVFTIHFCDGLHYLSEELLGSLCSKIAAGRRRNAVGERKGNRIERVCTVYCPGIRRASCIHHVVGRIERERNIVGDPENPISAADHHPARNAIGEADSWGEVVLIQRNVIPALRRYEKDVSQYGR